MGANHVNGAWEQEHDDALKRLRKDGRSASKAATAINLEFRTTYTRNAIIGRMHRLGMTEPMVVKRIKQAKAKALKPKEGPRYRPIRYLPPTINPAPIPRCDEVTPRNLTLLEVAEIDGCRWATNDGWPHLFCGLDRLEGTSYCPFHSAKSRGPGTSSERRAG